ncbi:hypothetical protein [Paramicrobacterium agarici]|uniref:hypothetical protein n=1 Tax=Paramicrobacterium agarici TaxID=630514 RepID=UPI00114FAA86|nr:hypothetical protein [Microbacterium agarici]TQO24260.1 hypothetical protein FB385_3140 [Microbacterium agarici]
MEPHETDIGLSEETKAAAQIAAYTERFGPINEVGVGYRHRLTRDGWSPEAADRIASTLVAAMTKAAVEETVTAARSTRQKKGTTK